MAKVLLTVSGEIHPDIHSDINAGKRPVADYIAMARTFQADLLDYTQARRTTGRLGRLLEKIGGPNLMLAWACYQRRHHYKVIFTDGEQVGIPLALLFTLLDSSNRAAHLMIVHILSVGKKMKFFDWFGIQKHIDTFFCYSTWQKQFIEKRWNVSPNRVQFTPFMVDERFFAPDEKSTVSAEIQAIPKPYICSVGLEFRDYPTLIEAVRDLGVHVVIAAGSPWSKRADSTEKAEIPENVTVRRFTQYELRQVYADSEFVVMPLYNVNFQAGVTAILEGMAMGKAIVCSRTPGQTDVIEDGRHGLYVPPEDAKALRAAIKYLLDNPAEAAHMGQAGRIRIEKEMSLTQYTQRLGKVVMSYLGKEASSSVIGNPYSVISKSTIVNRKS